MPAKLNLLERIAFRLNIGPAPVLDYVGALGLRAACSAERLGVFALLRESPRTDDEIARALRMHPRGVTALLDALESVGYVARRGDRCALTPMAAKWTPRFRDGVAWFEWMAFDNWPDVEACLASAAPNGRPWQRDGAHEETAQESAYERAQGALSTARLMADEVVRHVPVARSARRVLDVGGGHALYAARLCRRHPELRVRVVDGDETALALARDVVREEGVAERVELCELELFAGELGGGYDGALVFNTLNMFEPERRVELLSRVGAALAPNGFVAILDQMRLPTRRGASRAVVDLTNLRLFDPSSRGAYGVTDLSWLERAGFRRPRTVSLLGAPWMGLLIARRA